MSRRLITVLYEDQLAGGKPANYGPHVLALACVADLTGGDARAFENRVRAVPKKGAQKLRAALRDEGTMLANVGPVVAMFDSDRIRDCYQLQPDDCVVNVLASIRADSTGNPIIVLLDRNMEDVARACCAVLKIEEPEDKPRPQARDKILHAMAASRNVEDRNKLLASVPTFGRLVRALVELLRRHPSDP
jgi:hypothetical protein